MKNTALYDLYNKPLPEATKLMRGPMIMRKVHLGTIIEFLLYAYSEAIDILEKGDSLVKEIPFKKDDIAVILDGCGVFAQYIEASNLSDADLATLQKTQQALGAISLYHHAKIAASEGCISRLSAELSQININFNAARAAGNVT